MPEGGEFVEESCDGESALALASGGLIASEAVEGDGEGCGGEWIVGALGEGCGQDTGEGVAHAAGGHAGVSCGVDGEWAIGVSDDGGGRGEGEGGLEAIRQGLGGLDWIGHDFDRGGLEEPARLTRMRGEDQVGDLGF